MAALQLLANGSIFCEREREEEMEGDYLALY